MTTDNHFSLLTTINYYFENFLHLFDSFHTQLTSLNIYSTLVHQTIQTILLLLIFLTIYSLIANTHLTPGSFKQLIYHQFRPKNNFTTTTGILIDHVTKQPLSQAEVYLLDFNSHQIGRKLTTDKTGRFTFFAADASHHKLLVFKTGYQPVEYLLHQQNTTELHKIYLYHSEPLINRISHPLGNLVEISFFTLLITSFVFELIALGLFGPSWTLPDLALSCLTLVIFGLYQRIHHQNREYLS